jgi:phosphatidylglycerophosphatase A
MAKVFNRFLVAVGSVFGLGHIRGPSGTYASLATAAALGGLYRLGCPWWALFIAIFPLVAVGVVSAGATENLLGRKDPRPFVLDEVIGMMIAGLAAWSVHLDWPPGKPYAWATLAIAFVWFRVADVLKPPPIRQVERLPGGWGVVADDVLAGLLALVLTILTVYLLNHFL